MHNEKWHCLQLRFFFNIFFPAAFKIIGRDDRRDCTAAPPDRTTGAAQCHDNFVMDPFTDCHSHNYSLSQIRPVIPLIVCLPRYLRDELLFPTIFAAETVCFHLPQTRFLAALRIDWTPFPRSFFFLFFFFCSLPRARRAFGS